TLLAAYAERAVSRAMGGSCSMPLAAHATFAGDEMHLRAAFGDEATGVIKRAEGRVNVRTIADAEALGKSIAAQLQ
ncbi:MAG: hypothetical protein RLY95_448, partial [Pseudomonadota bacterium]